MSARDDLIEIVTRDKQSSGGDQTWATDLVDAHRAEVLAEDTAARDRMQRALLFALNWHGTPAELHAGINKILTEGGGR